MNIVNGEITITFKFKETFPSDTTEEMIEEHIKNNYEDFIDFGNAEVEDVEIEDIEKDDYPGDDYYDI